MDFDSKTYPKKDDKKMILINQIIVIIKYL